MMGAASIIVGLSLGQGAAGNDGPDAGCHDDFSGVLAAGSADHQRPVEPGVTAAGKNSG